MNIPKQLQNNSFRFTKIIENGKIPAEKEWTTKNNYEYSDPELHKHPGNYGVLTGIGNLIVIDFDNIDAWEQLKNILPKTFATKTATKGLPHLYYYCKDTTTKGINNEKGERIIDIQGDKRQVVCPGSSIDGKYYEIYKDIEIQELPIEKLEEIKKLNNKKKNNTKTILIKGDEQGNRNESLFKAACLYRVNKIDYNTALNLLKTANSNNNNPLPEQEIQTIVNSAYSYSDENEIQYEIATNETKEVTDKLKTLILMDLQLKKRNEATEKIVNYIKKKHYIYVTRNDNNPEFWIYENGIYVAEGKTYIKEIIRTILQEVTTTQIINLVLEKIELDNYIDENKFFNTNLKNEIPVLNGILNLETKQIKEYNPKKIFFNKINASYKPEQDCPNIKQFFKEIIENESDIKIIQELLGFVLYKEYFIEKAFMFLGNGRNGKSKTTELIKKLLGAENVKNFQLQQLTTEKPMISELHGSLANIGSEINNDSLKDTSIFKSLTGRDLITSDRKYKNTITFTNYAKLIFCANELPRTYDLSTAFFQRWILINFPYTFLPQKEYEERKQEPNIKLQNPYILEQISTEEEMSGLLNWAVEGLQNIKKQKEFSNSKTTTEIKEIWIRKSDSFSAFVSDCMVEEWNSGVKKADVRRAYAEYCKMHKLKGTSDKSIKIYFDNIGVTQNRMQNINEDFLYWEGISWNKDRIICENHRHHTENRGFSETLEILNYRGFQKRAVKSVMSVMENKPNDEKQTFLKIYFDAKENFTLNEIEKFCEKHNINFNILYDFLDYQKSNKYFMENPKNYFQKINF